MLIRKKKKLMQEKMYNYNTQMNNVSVMSNVYITIIIIQLFSTKIAI